MLRRLHCYDAGIKRKSRSGAIEYTIRGVPPEVDRILRRKAALRKKSLNQVILEELAAAAVGSSRLADFSDVIGKWTPDPEFDEIIRSQRRVDWTKWK